jgi:predicted AAA+ superfamily ATPase
LLQLLKEKFADALFLNFEDIRLVTFGTDDFERLLKEIEKRQIKILFFDEIQLVAGWEIFVHHLLREGYYVFITGSNASLLSGEMATHLTGRQLSIELFPFSFSEFIRYKNLMANEESLKEFLSMGGIPEYVKSYNSLIINTLVDDILIKDIAVRHAIKDVESLRQLALYLVCNVGNLLFANKLIDIFGIKSPSTILEYFSHLKDAYLVDFVPQFSYSLKKQTRNPKKVYSIDSGIVKTLGFNFSENQGHILENAVYLHLRRIYKEIYYFKGKNECDFVVCRNGKVQNGK